MESPIAYWQKIGLTDFYHYHEIPEKYQSQVAKTLRVLCDSGVLMSDYELYTAREQGKSMLIENSFGGAADIYAKAIDLEFKGFREGGPVSSQQDVMPARSAFYQMIRNYSREQIVKGIAAIEELQAKG